MKKLISLILFIGLLAGCEKPAPPEDINTVDNPILKSTSLIVPDDHATIQEAVNAAPDGSTITIKEGTYEELVQIYFRNNLTLIGENALICPPDEIIEGEGSFNIDILESSNIIVKHLKFDGKLDTKTYPIDRAIAFTNSSGEVTHNKIHGYSVGIACYCLSELPYPGPEDMIDITISKNDFTACYGQNINIIGNYIVNIEQNSFNFKFDHSRSFDEQFPHWFGIEMSGGTGTILKNKFKLQEGTNFHVYSVGIRLMMKSNNLDIFDYMVALHDLDVIQSIIKGTNVGISVNTDEEYALVWAIYGLSLQNTTFVQVDEEYLFYNNEVPIEIIP